MDIGGHLLHFVPNFSLGVVGHFWLNAGHGFGGREGNTKLCRGNQGYASDGSFGDNRFSKQGL